MGIAFSAAFQKKVTGVGKLGRDCMEIEPALKTLDKLAKKKKLPDLSSLLSVDPEEMAEMLDMDVEDLGAPPEQWFAPEEGLKTVRGLLAALAADPKAAKNQDLIAGDLKQLESELAKAAKQKVKFHFVMLD